MNILVVDDEPTSRLLLRSLLEYEGEGSQTVLLAENGEEALRKITGRVVDLIISDVYMPVMNGIEFFKTVREMPGFEKVPFLFVSGYDDHCAREVITNPRREGFFKKGSPAKKLLEWVRYLTAPEEKRPAFAP
jgi:CheY-like chemotaxis protein